MTAASRWTPLLALLVLLPFAAGAAPPAEPGPTASPAPPTWIRPEEVAIRADALLRALDGVEPSDQTRAEVAGVERDLGEFVPTLEALLVQARAAVARSTPFVELDDLQRELAGADATLEEWERAVTGESRRVAEALDEMTRARVAWLETRAHPETVAAGDVVLRRVDGSLAAIDATLATVQPWRVEVLALGDRVLDRRAAVATALRHARAATASEWKNLLVPGRAPLWSGDVAARLAEELPRVPAELRLYSATTIGYVVRDLRPLVLQILVAVVLAVVFRRLGDLARRSDDEPATDAHPWALAWLLVLLATPWFHPLSPQRFRQFMGILALAPGQIVASAPGYALPTGTILCLAILLLFDRLALALGALPTLSRLSMLTATAIGFALAWDVLRRLAARQAPAWLLVAVRLAMIGFAISFAAEVGGWDHLTAILGRGIAASGLVGVFVHAAVIGLEPMVVAGLDAPWFRRRGLFPPGRELLRKRVRQILRVAGTALWLMFVLRAIGLHAAALAMLQRVLEAGVTVGALSISVGTVLAFVLTLLAAMGFARVTTSVLEADVYPRTQLPRGVPFVLSTLVRYVVYSVGFLLALAAAGIQLGQLAILLGGLGVGLGLGLQDLVKNFAAGLTLLLERHVHPGDAVQLPGQSIFGRVLSIGMRATLVRAWDGSEVVVPNADLVAGAITNWTLSDRLCRIEVAVGVAYGTDPERVQTLLTDAARSLPRLLGEPAPVALFTGFGESSLDFLLRAWSDEGYDQRLVVTSELGIAVHRALTGAGIAIPFPQRDLHLASVDPAVADVLRR